MLTPQNFREKTFERAIFGGYDMGAVDNFLDEAAGDYAAVAKENMVLKSKMKVLVEKIEEYRATEDSMRMTLLSVQKLSTQMEQEAKEKADTILIHGQDEAERVTREAYNLRATEEAKLLEAKQESTRYIENMRLLCTRQLDFIDSLAQYKIGNTPSAPPPPATVEDTVRSIENSVERMTDSDGDVREIGRVVSDNSEFAAPSNEEPTRLFNTAGAAPTGAVSFDSLRFGK